MTRTIRNRFERCLALLAPLRPGEGRCVAILWLQAFSLMLAYYLIRPVREALILTEGGAEFRSYAVAVQAALLILIVPAYSAWVRRTDPRRPCRSPSRNRRFRRPIPPVRSRFPRSSPLPIHRRPSTCRRWSCWAWW